MCFAYASACYKAPYKLILFCEPVMTESGMSRCIGACFSAHAVKIFTTQVLDLRSLRYSNLFSDLMPWLLY